MPRAIKLVGAHEHRHADCIDTVILTSDQRRASRGEVVGVKGTRIALDLAEPPLMRTDDALLLEDGRQVAVVAAAEPLCEVRTADLAALSRLAWHLGDRHIAVEVLANRLRMRREPAVEALLAALGAAVTIIEAPFEPEGGAYAVPHDHDAYGQAHDHHHHDHRHK